MAKLTVYHGGYQPIPHPEIRVGRNTKDFGPGFYCTVIKEQAQRWAKRYRSNIVSIYEVRLNSALKIKEFPDMTDEWLDFIAECRIGKVHEFDIVEGPMADDTIWNFVNDFLNHNISRSVFWEYAKFKHPTHQISFHSIRALECLEYERSESVNDDTME